MLRHLRCEHALQLSVYGEPRSVCAEVAEQLAHALAALSALASRLAASQHPGHIHAVALVEALESSDGDASQDWATRDFGQHSLSLLATLRG